MKIERMKQEQFKDNHPQEIGYFINKYMKEVSELNDNPIDLEKKYTKKELQQIASVLGTAARLVIAMNRKGNK